MFWYTLRKLFTLFTLFTFYLGFSQMDELQLRDLRGDSLISLEEYNSPILVLVFDQFNCPYVREYMARMDTITKYYSSKGVQFVYVNADSDDFKKINFKDLAQKRYTTLLPNIPYIADRYAKYMYTLNIKKAPEVSVLVKEENTYKAVYVGGIDDSPLSEEDVRKAHLKLVLDKLLIGTKLAPYRERTIGCMIKRD